MKRFDRLVVEVYADASGRPYVEITDSAVRLTLWADEIELTDLRPPTCTAVMHHGPGHQSTTRCERRDKHGLEDEHYAPDPMAPGFEWRGAEAFD